MKTQLVILVVLSVFALGVQAAELAPDDPAIVDALVSWHRDAGANYQDGTWKATVGRDMITVGEAGDLDIYESPEPETWTPEEGFFEGLADVTGVLFSADISDLLVAEEVNGGDGFTDLTLIGVYQTTGNSDRTRPVGIGSRSEDIPVLGDAFNLSADASLRYDNGNNQTDPFFPPSRFDVPRGSAV